jgi:hypothetical protein
MTITKEFSPLPELTDLKRQFMVDVGERHNVYKNKRSKKPRPWTQSKILQTIFICNMYRELDKTTVWIREHWREPHAYCSDLWFAMTVARVVNFPESLEELGYPVPWNADHFIQVLKAREARGEKSFHQAYKPPTPPTRGMSRIDFVAKEVLTPIWKDRERLRKIVHMTLAAAHRELMKCPFLGSLLAAQIIADLKYVEPMKSADDWHTFAASGPGSRRGLNRILGRRVDVPWTEESWRLTIRKLLEELSPHYTARGLPVPHAQDLQNQLCEWDKMERIRLTPDQACLRRYPGLPNGARASAVGGQ